jgi:transposase-like protein
MCIRMDPHEQFCHNRRCSAYGRSGEGHLVIHSHKERRYRCKRCGRTFTETKDTAFYRMHKPRWLVLAVMTLLSYGCPVQAIVVAFDLDERTVARWQKESGSQCRRVHEHLVEAGKVALLQVQADEIRVKAVGGVFWLASAMEVRSRLGLGSVISQHRDGQLIGGLLIRVRACGPVEKRVVAGREAEVISRVIATQRSMLALINTAYIERLQATFRARLAPLVRRTRAGAHKHCTLEAGMWLVGSCYNLLWAHRSLGEERTPAMAAGLTDHRWSMEELLTFAVPPAEVPRWRGRKPKWLLEAEDAA